MSEEIETNRGGSKNLVLDVFEQYLEPDKKIAFLANLARMTTEISLNRDQILELLGHVCYSQAFYYFTLAEKVDKSTEGREKLAGNGEYEQNTALALLKLAKILNPSLIVEE